MVAFTSSLVVATAAFLSRSSCFGQADTVRSDVFIANLSNNQDADDNSAQEQTEEKVAAQKPKSRLALLAEDWLEDEEEDELQQYWERFEENKAKSNDNTAIPTTTTSSTGDDGKEELTTEQRLERYFDSRGIHKANEQKYAPQIEAAIAKAKAAATPEEAVTALQPVQPYSQPRTRLGGTALYELAVALWQRDGILDVDLVQELRQNSHMKRKIQQLARMQSPPARNPSFWQGFLDSNSNSWWN